MASNPSKLDLTKDKTVSNHVEPLAGTVRRRSPARDLDRKGPLTASDSQPYLDVPLQESFRPSIDTISGISNYSAETVNERSVRAVRPNLERISSQSLVLPRTWRDRCKAFWQRNKGLALVLLSQFFGGLMNVATRLLESGDGALSPFQILFARMSITAALCYIYMWWTNVKHAPLGKREVRWLLVARGLTGFFGVYGIYYTLIYLPIAEATVITFIAPIISCAICSVLLKEPFTRIEQIAGVVSLAGVVMIAQPSSFFPSHASSPAIVASDGIPSPPGNSTTSMLGINGVHEATPTERLVAVGVGLLGATGAAGAYTTIRWIGQRAHPLISVNYFATWCTLVSAASFFVPSVDFRLPATAREWSLLTSLGVCGFVMQFLLTAGLAHEKSSRATQMVYTQMLFALACDKIFWNTSPGVWSIAGSLLIIASALGTAVMQEGKVDVGGGEARSDEEIALVDAVDGADVEDEDERGPLRGVQEVQLRTMRI
ncbi:hypothetical protein MMC26_003196 [Xylographa opegraphella]|nr:hypothetical protein [Xylographa opegraphella]